MEAKPEGKEKMHVLNQTDGCFLVLSHYGLITRRG